VSKSNFKFFKCFAFVALSALSATANSAFAQAYELVDSTQKVVGEIIDSEPITPRVRVYLNIVVGDTVERIPVSFYRSGISPINRDILFPNSNCTGTPHMALPPPESTFQLGPVYAQFPSSDRYPTKKGLWVQSGPAVTQIFPSAITGPKTCQNGLTAMRRAAPLGKYVNVEAVYPPPYVARRKP
jgi:hypothetical protein